MKRSGPERSKASSLVTCSQPSPSLPIRQLSGMKASLKVTSFQSWRPARLMIGRMVTPGVLRSTRSWLSPLWRSPCWPEVRTSAMQ